MLFCPLLARSLTSRPLHAPALGTIYTVFKLYVSVFQFAACFEAWLHVCRCLALLENARDMVHYSFLGSLTAGLKQTTTFCTRMIAHLYHDLYQEFWAGSVALTRSLSWLTRVLSTLPIPPWLGPGASDRAQHLALQAPTSHQAQKRFWSTL
jgi:hypothetical protein